MTLSDTATAQLWEAFRVGGGAELIRDAVELVLQELIEAEAAAAIGAGRYERTQGRTTERNGHWPRLLATQAGDLELKIPKLRRGSFFPSVLEPRRRIDRALHAVIMEAYVAGVSTRSVDELVAALGAESGVSKSEVSRICAGLDEMVAAFRGRRLDHIEFPYVYVDATYLKVRNSVGQVTSMAMVIASGVASDGNREILGCDLGDSESEAFWQQFLTSLRDRGLNGVRLVISDAHRGLAAAVDRTLQGAARQRCRVHFIRNLLACVPRSHQHMAAALFRTIFAQPDAQAVTAGWDQVADQLAVSFPKVGPLMADAKEAVLAFTAFPAAHWQKIWSTNPLERINKEIPVLEWGHQREATASLWSAPSWPTSMTNGRQPTAATSQSTPWPSSNPRPTPSPQPNSQPAADTDAQPETPPNRGTLIELRFGIAWSRMRQWRCLSCVDSRVS